MVQNTEHREQQLLALLSKSSILLIYFVYSTMILLNILCIFCKQKMLVLFIYLLFVFQQCDIYIVGNWHAEAV